MDTEYLRKVGLEAIDLVKENLKLSGYPEEQEFVVAGGYFVDRLLGRVPKDIDVFIPLKSKVSNIPSLNEVSDGLDTTD